MNILAAIIIPILCNLPVIRAFWMFEIITARRERFVSFLWEIIQIPNSGDLADEINDYYNTLLGMNEIYFSFHKWSFNSIYPDMDARLAEFTGRARLNAAQT